MQEIFAKGSRFGIPERALQSATFVTETELSKYLRRFSLLCNFDHIRRNFTLAEYSVSWQSLRETRAKRRIGAFELDFPLPVEDYFSLFLPLWRSRNKPVDRSARRAFAVDQLDAVGFIRKVERVVAGKVNRGS